MPVRNPNFYSLQATRRYPLDDRATGVGDGGERLNDSILVDCQLRFPQAAGAYAYVGSVTVTARLVSVTFLAAASPEATTGFTPLAVLSLPQPVEQHRHYPLSPMLPGVGGFAVFGNTDEPFAARFSTPQQGLLLQRCATAYQPLPIPSLRKEGNAVGLTGVVQLLTGSDIAVSVQTRVLDSQSVSALVFQLAQQVVNRDVLQLYLGPCDQRPESRTCDRDGVETINQVKPDCDGNLTIRFVGMTARPYDSCDPLPSIAGVTLDQSLGIDEVCQDTTEPGHFDGVDACAPLESSSSLGSRGFALPAPKTLWLPPEEPLTSSELAAPLALALEFDPDTEPPLTILSGDFVLETTDEGTACVTNTRSQQSIALLTGEGSERSDDIQVAAELSITRSQSLATAGLVLNYRDRLKVYGPPTYYAVVLDRASAQLQLRYWHGKAFHEVHSVRLRETVQYEHRYLLTAKVRKLPYRRAALSLAVRGITQPEWRGTQFSTTLGDYQPADGAVGLWSDRSLVRFWRLTLEDFHD